MIEGIFALVGVVIGGVITAITNYFLHKAEVKYKKREHISLKQEELYNQLLLNINHISSNYMLPTENIDNKLFTNLIMYGKKEILDLIVKFNNKVKERKLNIVDEKLESEIIQINADITNAIRKELGIIIESKKDKKTN